MTTGSTIDRLRSLIAAGETDLATIEAIRAVHRWWPEDPQDAIRLPALAEILNILGVLRHGAGDLRGAVGCFEAALSAAPAHHDAACNLADAAPALAAGSEVTLDRAITSSTLNPWTERILNGLRSTVDIAGRDVLEIGGAIPPSVVRELGVRRWAACDPQCPEVDEPGYAVHACDAVSVPYPDESFDVVFSSCAFEHFLDVPAVVREVRRVLRPGGVLFSEHGPLWTHADGHHLYVVVDDVLLDFNHPVVPRWGHLLLTRAELRRFLSLGWGAEAATVSDRFIHESDKINRVPEAAHRSAYWLEGMEVLDARPLGTGGVAAAPMLQAELQSLHPDGSNFNAFTYQILLRKPLPVRLATAEASSGDAPVPAISVVVAAASGTPFGDAVTSVFAQTTRVAEVVLVHPAADVDAAAAVHQLAAMDPRIVVVAGPSDRAAAVMHGLRVAKGDLVAVIDPFDTWLPHAVSCLLPPLLDAPDVVAVVGGSVRLDEHGVPAVDAQREPAFARTVVIDGATVVADQIIGGGGQQRSMDVHGALLRASAVRPVLADVASLPGSVARRGLWCALVARGPIVGVPQLVNGVAPLDADGTDPLHEWALVSLARRYGLLHDVALDERITRTLLSAVVSVDELRTEHLPALADLAARLPMLQAEVALTGPGAMRPVGLVVEATTSIDELWPVLEAALGTAHADLVDLVLVDASAGELRRPLDEVAVALGAQFSGQVRVVGRADVEVLRSHVYLASVTDPADLRSGWLSRLLAEVRSTSASAAKEGGARLWTRSGAGLVDGASNPSGIGSLVGGLA